jgi:cysteine sulfinate desulfinase/cysteine desulfurase-like protein
MTQHSIIYFDNAATSGKKPEAVKEALCDCLEHANANPGRSGHSLSVKAAEIVYTTREVIGEFFNFHKTENIVLTRNATEALNIALYGSLESGDEVVTTSMEPLFFCLSHDIVSESFTTSPFVWFFVTSITNFTRKRGNHLVNSITLRFLQDVQKQ